jgi:hypothetical protein
VVPAPENFGTPKPDSSGGGNARSKGFLIKSK